MSGRSFWLAWVLGLIAVGMMSAVAIASDLDEGTYTLNLPGLGSFGFEIDSGGSVSAISAPPGYTIVDADDLDKAAWEDVASLDLEVEAKLDKIEADHDWANGEPVVLALPLGGSITVTAPDSEGNFTVEASGGWWEFGGGSDWYVVNNADITAATEFFKVEADSDGVEIKPSDSADDGFLTEEAEIEEVEVEDE